MFVISMTGFGSAEGTSGAYSWVWELRSVNGRGLDLRFRLPPELQSMEAALREMIAARLTRGSIQASLRLNRTAGSSRIQINEEALQNILAVIARLDETAKFAPSTADGVLNIRGVVEQVEAAESDDETAARMDTILQSFGTALTDLCAARAAEGERLAHIITSQVEQIDTLTEAANGRSGNAVRLLRERIGAQLSDLLEDSGSLPEERLAQEVAMLATKADIREEIDRLQAHVLSAKELLTQQGPIGRKLDFLTQEFNREANTLCSKSPETELTRIGLELKALIDQLREQVQNVE